jgi:hypothetical protein
MHPAQLGNSTKEVSMITRDARLISIMPSLLSDMVPRKVKTTGLSETPGLLIGEKKVTSESLTMVMEMVSAVSLWTLQDQPLTDSNLYVIIKSNLIS